jgi:hypothetical protein
VYGPDETFAYISHRLLPSFAVCHRVLSEVKDLMPGRSNLYEHYTLYTHIMIKLNVAYDNRVPDHTLLRLILLPMLQLLGAIIALHVPTVAQRLYIYINDDANVVETTGFEPVSQLDFGSGPGTAVLASRRVWGHNDTDSTNDDSTNDSSDNCDNSDSSDSDSEQDDDHDQVLP